MDTEKDPNFKLLSSTDFVPEQYVKEISQNYVGGTELLNLKKKIQLLDDETSNNLKKNVYQNYVQFIETGKEISHLESEMYQLSHLLSEQKSLLNALSSTSILDDSLMQFNNLELADNNNQLNAQEIEEENKQKLLTILEKVEGCKEVVETVGRVYIYEGDLLEIDATENVALKFVHMYLFNDGLMVTNRNSNPRDPKRYAFESLYELSSLAVVNVRDLGNIKHAFKLLIFPDTRVFQCSSNATKKEWLDKIDQAKKIKLNASASSESTTEKRRNSSTATNRRNTLKLEETKTDIEEIQHPEWLLDILDELDVFIAQRQFEDAVNYLNKAQNYLNKNSSSSSQIIQEQLEEKQNSLIDLLIKELEVNPEKSLQGGLRGTRTAVRLLNQLGRSTQSCDLFLKLCSSMLKIQSKRVKREGSTTTYIRNLASVIFTNMSHMCEEFLRAFPEMNANCTSAFVVWASGELSLFSTHLGKQIFMPQTPLSTIRECVVFVRDQCERLCTYGVDFRYQLDGALRAALTKSIQDNKEKIIDGIKVRINEEKWIPINLKTKNALAKFLQEYTNLGVKLDSYVTGDVWLQLAFSNLVFTKIVLNFIDDCLQLKTTELLHTIDETLLQIFQYQLQYNEQAYSKNADNINNNNRQFIGKNFEFLLTIVKELIQTRYRESVGHECDRLNQLSNEYLNLFQNRSTKMKYSSEFL